MNKEQEHLVILIAIVIVIAIIKLVSIYGGIVIKVTIFIVCLVTFLSIVNIVIKIKSLSSSNTRRVARIKYEKIMEIYKTEYYESSRKVVEQIKENDKLFSETMFTAWISQLFIKLNRAFSIQDLELIKPYVSKEVYDEYNRVLEINIENGLNEKRDEIDIEKVMYLDYKIKEEENLTVHLEAYIHRYIKDVNNKIIIGTDIYDFKRDIEMHLIKREEIHSTVNCESCGAPVDIADARCKYCNSIIKFNNFGWILDKIEQKQKYDDIGH